MIAMIDEYRKELLQIKTFAGDTVQNYVSCIVSYCEYAKKTLKIVPVYSKGPHILKWMAHLREKGISNSRMQNHHSALKTFFALLCKLKIITKNPAQALPVIRKKRSDRNKPISKKVALKLLRSVDQLRQTSKSASLRMYFGIRLLPRCIIKGFRYQRSRLCWAIAPRLKPPSIFMYLLNYKSRRWNKLLSKGGCHGSRDRRVL